MVTLADIKYRFSILTGTAGNSLAQGSSAASLGKYMSTTDWTGGVKNDIFPDVTPSQNAAGYTDYRCIFIYNASTDSNWLAVKLWLEQTAGGSEFSIGLDPAGVVVGNSTSAQAVEVATVTSAPVGVSFSQPGIGSEFSIGNLPFGSGQAVWIRRATSNSLPMSGDAFNLRTQGVVL